MQGAFQTGETLLSDIATARASGETRLWWLGQSGFLLHAHGKSILFDPYLSDSLTEKYEGTDKPHVRMTERVIPPERLQGMDVITSSHNHTDHLDRETLLPLLEVNREAKLLIPEANEEFVLARLGKVKDRLVTIDAGQRVEVAGVQFVGVPAAHNAVEKDARGRCRFLGFVARIGPVTIFHSGDTLLHEGLQSALEPFSLSAVLLPINGHRPERGVAGNMDGAEAARLARSVGARLVVPHHFDMFEFNTVSPSDFEQECRRIGQAFRTLRNGEGSNLPML
jgi:L-ascorbate metabolism protein UlaG (beta-lactamase superfamily)